MRNVVLATVLFVISGFATASAQEGCQAVQSSCSEMKARCESICQREPNPARCIAARCEGALPGCKATGIWRVQGGAGCWKTTKRS